MGSKAESPRTPSAATHGPAALSGARLRALVADQWGEAERRPVTFGPGAALEAGEGSAEAWIYPAEPPERGLGAALVWADHHGVARLHLLADHTTDDVLGLLARQAAYFTTPAVDVWAVDGRDLVAASATPPPERVVATPPSELVDLMIDAGLEVVAEGGIVRGEINGLEVARIAQDQTTAGVPLVEPLLEVGVGVADRELTAMLHGELSPVAQLDRAVPVVRRLRQAEATHHPLNQLVPERWLRAVLCRDPQAVGLARLRPAETVRPRANLGERHVAVAVGEVTTTVRPGADPGRSPPTTHEGRRSSAAAAADAAQGRAVAGTGTVVVVCSVGVDVDLVPVAADARGALDPGAELWLVVPERDDHPTTRRLAAHLRMPARVVTVPDAWRAGL